MPVREEIPDDSLLYRRVHKSRLSNGDIKPNSFHGAPSSGNPTVHEMSVDWDKYSTPQDCLQRARKPMENAVVSLNTGVIRRRIDTIKVEHSPQPDNLAHSDVKGDINSPKVRILLCEVASIVIPLQHIT
ncbi:MAG: hypothetical protein M1351_02255 [Candidatus Thermoplasmatota archaeon]|nr:hypothetical protein [Candidatus Thermoplasmatota archaeon]